MKDEGKATNDCYTDGERAWMVRFQQWRAIWLAPLCNVLARSGLNADHLTLLSLLCGLIACPLLLMHKALALLFILLHVLLDGLDGPLARHCGTDSNRGSFTDTAADQLVIACTMITLIYLHHADALAGGIYVFAYTVAVGFAMIRNALRIPYSWMVRPRFAVYAWLPVEFYLWPGSLDYVLWIFNALLCLKMLTGFLRIRREL